MLAPFPFLLHVLHKGYPGTMPAHSRQKATVWRMLPGGKDDPVGGQKATVRGKVRETGTTTAHTPAPVQWPAFYSRPPTCPGYWRHVSARSKAGSRAEWRSPDSRRPQPGVARRVAPVK